MDLQELLNTLANQVAFWSKSGEQPGTLPIVNKTRDAFRETGKVVDDYVLGGTFQANMRGQDALLRQLALNAVAGGVGAGVGVGAAKVVPKVGAKLAPQVAALRQWIKPRDIGVHLSPFKNLDTILPNINKNMGAGETIGYPLVPGQTYKLSSVDVNNLKVPAKTLSDIVEEYSGAFANKTDDGILNAYVTRSKIGLPDPEVLGSIGKKFNYGNQEIAVNGANARIIPKQNVLGSIKVWAPSGEEPIGYFTETQKEQLARFIEKQQLLEKLKSLGRGAVVGGSAAGTVLTPLVAARPALGFNNRR